MIWLVLALAATSPPDPRPAILELELRGKTTAALAATEQALRERPAAAGSLGLEYLRGRLLERLDRPGEALRAFAAAMVHDPLLAPYARYHLAEIQAASGHPEVAAGLVATLLGNGPPAPLVPAAVDLLSGSLAGGGDCRLLRGLDPAVPTAARRRLELLRAACAAANGDTAQAESVWRSLIDDDRRDEVSRRAAVELSRRIPPADAAPRLARLVGLSFHQHREFRPAADYLRRALAAGDESPRSKDGFETAYALARGEFWQGRYAAAGEQFEVLAKALADGEHRAQALFQAGRCRELLGDLPGAAGIFLQAYDADPSGPWSDAAIFAALRCDRLSGARGAARDLLATLDGHATWRETRGRALLFLATSEIARGERGDAASWIRQAAVSGGLSDVEAPYWKGRLAELEGDWTAATNEYLETLVASAFHPLARDARARLRSPPLAATARSLARRLATSSRSHDLYRAWLLQGDDDPAGAEIRRRLVRMLAASSRYRSFLDPTTTTIDSWPLWSLTPDSPELALLQLGLWDEGADAVSAVFPLSDPELAFTGARVLALGGNVHAALYRAEVLAGRAPHGFPTALMSGELLRLLYPFPYRRLILDSANRRRIDPALLLALIREESRFDPGAVSPASAHGLTQIVLPTAREVADAAGLELEPGDLHDPAVAISLGATHLADLLSRFSGHPLPAIAAYNAGTDQAALWQSYCLSDDPAEYFSKVSFRETRSYLRRVMTSWAIYRMLWMDDQRAR